MTIAMNKSISNKAGSHFLPARAAIVTSRSALCYGLWCHHQDVNRASETQSRYVKIVFSIAIY